MKFHKNWILTSGLLATLSSASGLTEDDRARIARFKHEQPLDWAGHHLTEMRRCLDHDYRSIDAIIIGDGSPLFTQRGIEIQEDPNTVNLMHKEWVWMRFGGVRMASPQTGTDPQECFANDRSLVASAPHWDQIRWVGGLGEGNNGTFTFMESFAGPYLGGHLFYSGHQHRTLVLITGSRMPVNGTATLEDFRNDPCNPNWSNSVNPRSFGDRLVKDQIFFLVIAMNDRDPQMEEFWRMAVHGRDYMNLPHEYARVYPMNPTDDAGNLKDSTTYFAEMWTKMTDYFHQSICFDASKTTTTTQVTTTAQTTTTQTTTSTTTQDRSKCWSFSADDPTRCYSCERGAPDADWCYGKDSTPGYCFDDINLCCNGLVSAGWMKLQLDECVFNTENDVTTTSSTSTLATHSSQDSSAASEESSEEQIESEPLDYAIIGLASAGGIAGAGLAAGSAYAFARARRNPPELSVEMEGPRSDNYAEEYDYGAEHYQPPFGDEPTP